MVERKDLSQNYNQHQHLDWRK